MNNTVIVADIAEAIRKYTGLEWNIDLDNEAVAFGKFVVARIGKYIYKINGETIKNIIMCGEGTKIAFKLEVYHMENGFIMDFDIEDKNLQWTVGQIDGIITLFN